MPDLIHTTTPDDWASKPYDVETSPCDYCEGKKPSKGCARCHGNGKQPASRKAFEVTWRKHGDRLSVEENVVTAPDVPQETVEVWSVFETKPIHHSEVPKGKLRLSDPAETYLVDPSEEDKDGYVDDGRIDEM